MVKNLNQLKKVMKGNPRFQIIAHCRKECVGEIRQVTQTNTDGVCSAYDSDTTHTEDHLIMAFRILDEQEEAA